MLCLFVLGFCGTGLPAQTTNLFWQKQNIYQIISDRFYNGNTNRLKVALAFFHTSPSFPCLYYGTEQGFDGTTTGTIARTCLPEDSKTDRTAPSSNSVRQALTTLT